MRVAPGTDVARRNVAETISALWTFANALGLLTDDITERTPAAGVTIGGVRLANIAIDLLGLASPANRILGSDVVGDADERFRLHAGGIMQWGDGTGARDTELRREAANELGTPDDFNVGGVLDLASDIELADRTITLASGPNADVATGTVPVQRLDTAAGAATISGFAGGRAGRLLILYNIAANDVQILHQDGASTAANRCICPNGVNVLLNEFDSMQLRYDATVSRWQVISKGI